MSNEARDRILRMVAEGKVSPEEAAKLLEAAEPKTEQKGSWEPGASGNDPSFWPGTPGNEPSFGQGHFGRNLVIHVEQSGNDKVDIRIPIGLARAAGRFIPRMAQKYLDEYDIDLQELVQDMGASLTTGPLIRVEDEDDKVVIAVE